MAFRLKANHSIANRLSRLVDKQLRAALVELTRARPSGVALHQARTRVKKVRAVLRLLKSGLGSTYRTLNERLRSAAHLLSELRDVDAAVETLHALRARYPTVLTGTIIRTVEATLRAGNRPSKTSANRQFRRAARELRSARRQTATRVRHAGGAAAITAGAIAGYQRARRAMSHLSMGSDDTSFHAWRRRVKDHWYHLRLFEGLHPNAGSRARRVAKLEKLLGDEHNLVVLRTMLLSHRHGLADARTTSLVFGCITKSQAWLRKRTLRMGHRLFNARPKVFGKSVRKWAEGE